MAFSVVKRVGAPSGSISISIGNSTYLIDDGANSVISANTPAELADLLRHPYLQLQGGAATPYVPPTPSGRGELGYVEATSSFQTTNDDVYRDVTGLSLPQIQVAALPVMLEVYSPRFYGGTAAATGRVRVVNSAGTVAYIHVAHAPVAAFGMTPFRAIRRLSLTPGTYDFKVQVLSASGTNTGPMVFDGGTTALGSNAAFQAAWLPPAFLRVTE